MSVEVTMISMTVGIGTGYATTFNACVLTQPEEVRIQKKLPRGMKVEVFRTKIGDSTTYYKKAVETSAKGGRINWKEWGYCLGAASVWGDGHQAAFVSIPQNAILLVNDD